VSTTGLVKRQTLLAVIGAAALIGAAAWLYDHYQFSVIWPNRVQRELFGTTLANANSLASSERHFAYGQGFARWRYKMASTNPSLQRLCGNIELAKCSLNKHRTVDRGVDVHGVLSGGVLTVEEWWS
jgi:hypothetical protein